MNQRKNGIQQAVLHELVRWIKNNRFFRLFRVAPVSPLPAILPDVTDGIHQAAADAAVPGFAADKTGLSHRRYLHYGRL
jgi:hypothetical protein